MMRGWKPSVGIALAILAVTLGGCDLVEPKYIYRYRMTLEVDTPQGLRTGSGVIEVKLTDGVGISGGSVVTNITGEAVPVDLPNGTTMFAVLDRVSGIAGDAIYPHLPEVSIKSRWTHDVRLMKRQTATYELPRSGRTPLSASWTHPEIEGKWPMLVYFRDIRDPKSVERVDPANASAVLGPGVSIRRIIVQITHDPVTTGVVRRLPWLKSLEHGGWLGGVERRADGRLLPTDYSRPDRNLIYSSFVMSGEVL